MRNPVKLEAFVLVLSILSACSGPATTPVGTAATATAQATVNLGEIQIGALYPLTGPNAEAAILGRNATAMAADVLNGKYPNIDIAPLKIAKIKLLVTDNQSNPQVCASEVDRMKAEGAVALVGGWGSSTSIACSNRAEQVGLPYVDGGDSSPVLVSRGLKWFFHVGPTDETFTETYFKWLDSIKAKHPVRNASIVYVNNQFGNDAAAAIQKLADQNAMKIVDRITYDPNVADLSSQVQKLRAGAPDAVFYIAQGADAVLFMRTLQQFGYTPPALLTFGAFNVPSVLASLSTLAEGVVVRSAWSQNVAASNPLAKAVADQYKTNYGVELAENAAREFEGMIVMGQAIETARSTNPEAIRAALVAYSRTKTIMAWDGIKFGPNGQNQFASAIIEQRKGNGFVMLYPTVQAEVVWPLPPLR